MFTHSSLEVRPRGPVGFKESQLIIPDSPVATTREGGSAICRHKCFLRRHHPLQRRNAAHSKRRRSNGFVRNHLGQTSGFTLGRATAVGASAVAEVTWPRCGLSPARKFPINYDGRTAAPISAPSNLEHLRFSRFVDANRDTTLFDATVSPTFGEVRYHYLLNSWHEFRSGLSIARCGVRGVTGGRQIIDDRFFLPPTDTEES